MALTVTVLSFMCLIWVGLVQSMPRYNSLMSYHSLQEPKEQQDYSAEWQGNAFFSGGYHPRVRTNRQPMNRPFSTGMDQFRDQAPSYGSSRLNRLYNSFDRQPVIEAENDQARDWENDAQMSVDEYYKMLTDMAEMREGESNPRYTDEREMEDDFYMNSPLDNPMVIEKEILDDEILQKIFKGEEDFVTSQSPNDVQDKMEDRNRMLHRMGMRLVDLSEEQTTNIPEMDEVNDSIEVNEETTSLPVKEAPEMSMEKAKALLKRLQVEEEARGKSPQKRTSVVGQGELSEMLGSPTSSEEVPEPADQEVVVVGGEAIEATREVKTDVRDDESENDKDEEVNRKDIMEDIMKLDEVKDSLRNTEIDLLKEENEFLIKAIEDAVNAPIELVQSPANLDYMRSLVREAALRQNAVDFIDQKLDELEK